MTTSAVIILDGDGRIEAVSSEATDLLGPWTDALIGARASDLIHTEPSSLRPGGAGSGQILGAHTVQLAAHGLGERTALVVSDVGSEALAETTLLASMIDNAPIGKALVAPDGSFERVNRSLCRILGYSEAELLRLSFRQITSPADLDTDSEHVRQLLAGEIRDYQMEKRYLHRHGHVIWGRLSVSLVRDPAGAPLHFISQIEDITEKKGYEAERETLHEIAEFVATNAGPGPVFEVVTRGVQELLDANSSSVTRFSETDGTGVVLVSHTADGHRLDGLVFGLDEETASARVYRTGRASQVDGPMTDPRVDRYFDEHAITGAVATPIIVAGQVWGSLTASFSRRAIPRDAEERLKRFCHLITLAIANAEAWDTLERYASTDALTGLVNRRAFNERLRAEMASADRDEEELSLVLFDLDHFKVVNDTHGHQVGDGVLADVGALLSAHARRSDTIARFGGEEFAWLMPLTAPLQAFEAIERLRRAIAEHSFETAGAITISAGVSTYAQLMSAGSLISHADRALYRAKHHGRNAVCLHPDAPASLAVL